MSPGPPGPQSPVPQEADPGHATVSLPQRLLPASRRRSLPAPRSPLTFGRCDEVLPVLDELFYELVGPLQLRFVGADPLPEPRAVQVAVAELQRGMPHGSAGED